MSKKISPHIARIRLKVAKRKFLQALRDYEETHPSIVKYASVQRDEVFANNEYGMRTVLEDIEIEYTNKERYLEQKVDEHYYSQLNRFERPNLKR